VARSLRSTAWCSRIVVRYGKYGCCFLLVPFVRSAHRYAPAFDIVAALVMRLGHLGNTQVGDRQLKVALVSDLCVCVLGGCRSERVQLVSVPL
jgi:hypothetical protein